MQKVRKLIRKLNKGTKDQGGSIDWSNILNNMILL